MWSPRVLCHKLNVDMKYSGDIEVPMNVYVWAGMMACSRWSSL